MIPRWHKKIKRERLPCDRKKNYNTYEEAVRIAIIRVESGEVEFLRAYGCQDARCGKFHLTSQREPRKGDRWPGFEGVANEPDGAAAADEGKDEAGVPRA